MTDSTRTPNGIQTESIGSPNASRARPLYATLRHSTLAPSPIHDLSPRGRGAAVDNQPGRSVAAVMDAALRAGARGGVR